MNVNTDNLESREVTLGEHRLQAVAEANDYETAEEYLSDSIFEVRCRLANANYNTFGLDNDEIKRLLVDEQGDIEVVVEGYLEW